MEPTNKESGKSAEKQAEIWIARRNRGDYESPEEADLDLLMRMQILDRRFGVNENQPISRFQPRSPPIPPLRYTKRSTVPEDKTKPLEWTESPQSGEHIKAYTAAVPDDVQSAIIRNVEESKWREQHPAHARSGWSIAQAVVTRWTIVVGFMVVIGWFIWYLIARK